MQDWEQSRERDLLSGQLATRQHQQDVANLLLKASRELTHRAEDHDASKLGSRENEKFSLAAARFKEPGNEYGSPGYEETKKWLGGALKHHYEHNSHHPEHYAGGVRGMNLFDILEMLIDWKAASARRSEDGKLDLTTSEKVHKIPEELMLIIRNTADYLGFNYK